MSALNVAPSDADAIAQAKIMWFNQRQESKAQPLLRFANPFPPPCPKTGRKPLAALRHNQLENERPDRAPRKPAGKFYGARAHGFHKQPLIEAQ